MKKIVITGATGFIGAPLVKKFIDNKYEVYAVVRPGSPNLSRIQNLAGVQLVSLDVNQIEELPQYVPQADYFVHTAWEGIRGAARMDCLVQQRNYENSLKAAKAAKSIGCEIFFGIGSQAEYGVVDGIISETTTEWPNTEYGRMKLATYKALQRQYSDTAMQIVWGRVFSAYGPGDTAASLIDTCIREMRADKELLLTECIQDWNYVYIDDVVEAVYRMITTEKCEGIYNIASWDNRSLKEYVLELKKILKSDSEIHFGAVPYGEAGPVGFKVDISKLCDELQWIPAVSFAEGIQKKIRIEEDNENN